MGTSLGGGVPSGGDEASAGAAVQSHRPSSSVVSERYLPLPLTPPYRCGVLVELLAYAIIVGLLATLVYCTRPHPPFGAQVELRAP